MLSAGGDDLAGPQFGLLLNNKYSPHPGWNDKVVDALINDTIKTAHQITWEWINKTCRALTGNTVPILVHGYANPVPDGRAVGPYGPWLKPGFDQNSYLIDVDIEQLVENFKLMCDLLARFNDMLKGLAAQFGNVQYVDLRGSLDTPLPVDKAYWDLWGNELHPTDPGFEVITEKIISQLP